MDDLENREEVKSQKPVFEEPEFDLEAIIREVHDEEAAEYAAAHPEEFLPAQDIPPAPADLGDTIRLNIPAGKKKPVSMEDTIRLDSLSDVVEQVQKENKEAFTEGWEPEYDQPIGDYIPPQPIIFQPRSRLRELKKKLVAGPERRYYELTEKGVGKLQALIFLSLLVVLLSAGATAMYAMGMVGQDRIKLMVFCQFFTLLLSALLGSHQMLDGIFKLFQGKFTLNAMLLFTFIACCVDGVFCLSEQRIPCCAAFSLQVTMSLWKAYHERAVETDQMDTLRRATRLDSLAQCADYYDGKPGLLRGEGQPEDFMDHYQEPAPAEKVLNSYALLALTVSLILGVAAGILHASVSFGAQVVAVSMLAAVPVCSFITVSRPQAILEKQLHALGSVLCGWKSVKALCKTQAFPISHADLFPSGSCKLNGVKFYGDHDPDLVTAYATALMTADGGGLAPLFSYLLESRNGRHFEVENLRIYEGSGIGGEVDGEIVLLGGLQFLKDMGVEIPDGIRVNQAVYVAIDGELSGLFAITYGKTKSATSGLHTLCSYRRLKPILMAGDFILTKSFLRSRFGVNTKRLLCPDRQLRLELLEKEPDEDAPALALATKDGLAGFAFAVTGARSLRTAAKLGAAVQILGGIVGLAMMAVLAYIGAGDQLSPERMLVYELIWLVPGLLITELTRSI